MATRVNIGDLDTGAPEIGSPQIFGGEIRSVWVQVTVAMAQGLDTTVKLEDAVSAEVPCSGGVRTA